MKASKHSLHFLTGWRLILHRIIFLMRAMKYAIHRKQYPLFRLKASDGGLLTTLRMTRTLFIQKQVQFNGAYFSSLISPHYPSPAFDRMAARGGLNGGAAGTPLRQQMDTVILAITRQCSLGCRHCYERHNLNGEERISVRRWNEVIHQIQELGASIIVLSGGEPLDRYDGLLDMLTTGNKDLSDFHLHTSGHGLTMERAHELREAGLIAAAISLDDADAARHDEILGRAGAHSEAVAALRLFREAGVMTYTNLCLHPTMVRTGALWSYYDLTRELQVAFIQMLEPRPCGGYQTAGEDAFLTETDRALAKEFFIAANTQRRFRSYPVVHYVAYAENPQQLGCRMAGLSHLHIDSMGNVNPCVFLPVTFGNILHEDFPAIYRRMRRVVRRPIRTECPSLLLAETLRMHNRMGYSSPVPFEQIQGDWEALFGDPRACLHPSHSQETLPCAT